MIDNVDKCSSSARVIRNEFLDVRYPLFVSRKQRDTLYPYKVNDAGYPVDRFGNTADHKTYCLVLTCRGWEWQRIDQYESLHKKCNECSKVKHNRSYFVDVFLISSVVGSLLYFLFN